MGCPEISYNKMCYEADRNIRNKEKIDDTVDIREIEKRLKMQYMTVCSIIIVELQLQIL